MQEQKENESGSMMLEIIAVLAILAIMTPIVYQQSLKRSREVSNVNMADEMRSVKNAVKAYLDANLAALTASDGVCGSVEDADAGECELNDEDEGVIGKIYDFLPEGQNVCFNGIGCEDNYSEYEMTLLKYTQEYTNSDNETITVPKLFAVLSSYQQPAKLNRVRAMKIASLIGSAGGICKKDTEGITGSYGGWELNKSYSCQSGDDVDWTVVVRTDM